MKDRRKLLKGLAVSSAWATPVVSSVVLPVHARSSGPEQCLEQTIPEQTVGCANIQGDWNIYPYEIRAVDQCFAVVPLDPFTSPQPPGLLTLPSQVALVTHRSGRQIQVTVVGYDIAGNPYEDGQLNMTCNDPQDFESDRELKVEDTGGTERSATAKNRSFAATLTATTGVVTVT